MVHAGERALASPGVPSQPDEPSSDALPTGRFRGRLWLWGLAIGALSGLLDTLFFLHLGIDLHVAGRDLTSFVAAYLGASFATLGAAIGWAVDSRARARHAARVVREKAAALEASQRAARESEKLAAIGRLAAGVAHEVRNPLGVIRASASMVQESFDPDSEPHRACGFICEEIDRLNGLIGSLLSYARPTQPRLERLSVEKLADRALSLGAGELTRRRIAVERTSEGAAPEVVADPDQLVQVLLSLVTNAAEAVGADGRVALRLSGDAEHARVDVADDGPGVSLEDAERVFEPFFTTKDAGTGLGLAMTARLVHAHGGRIQVLPGRGVGPGGAGACFRVELPAAPSQARP